MTKDQTPNWELPEELDKHTEEILEYVRKYSPRPTADGEIARRILEEAPPAQAAEELARMIESFGSGGGAATGRRSAPAAEESPIESLPEPADRS